MIPRSTSSKHYPYFIRSHSLLKNFKRESIFPKIGIKNCEEKISSQRKIVFSSTGNKALWDISTMSMRGINSCQNWMEDEEYTRHLVGSMIDPYCGIIYLTDNKEVKIEFQEYPNCLELEDWMSCSSTRMLKRAIVRFIIHKKNKSPALFLEPIYSAEGSRSPGVFIDFLKKKVKSKLPVISEDRNPFCDQYYYIPSSKGTAKLSEEELSYRDSCIPYIKDRKFYNIKTVKL